MKPKKYIFSVLDEKYGVYMATDAEEGVMLGDMLLSFDKKKVYNMFVDYPKRMSKKEVEILDEIMPELTRIFKHKK